MTLEPSTVDDKKRQPHELEEVVLSYLKAVDAGEAPKAKEFLKRHPDLAPQLAEFFADQEQLDSVVRPLRELAPTAPYPRPGSRFFGDFEILSKIAQGGMGDVYKARQLSLNRIVALKTIAAKRLPDADSRARFRAEARAVAKFDHPNIVRVFECGEEAGRPYYALEFVAGGSLAQARKGRPWAPQAAAKLVLQLAEAVEYAHSKGIVHRDLKPANILLTKDGIPKITDFGLSKQLQADAAGLTRPGDRLGTPAYMAPEQAVGQLNAIGPGTDIFGLGAILYHLLTGRPPFEGDTLEDILRQARQAHFRSPRELNPAIPPALEKICCKAMAVKPVDRYPSAAAMAEALQRFLRRSRRRALVLAGLTCLVVAGCSAGLLASGFIRLPLFSRPRVDPPNSSGPSGQELAQKAHSILQANCHRCHGQDGNAEGGFNYVLDRSQLVARKKVVEGKPEASKLFKRVREGDMPPEGEQPRPSADDIAVIEEWIREGAADFGTPTPQRQFIAPDEMARLIQADLEKADEPDRKFLRYFTLSHLYNAGLSEDELQTYRHALSKLVNSLSRERRIVVPTAIDNSAKTIFRIDLRDYKWSEPVEPVWDLILAAYPYGIETETDAALYCRQTTQCRVPYVRADWFVFAASRPPLYHEVLQLPRSARELEKLLQVDVAEKLRQGRGARAGFMRSGVASNNRLIQRFDTIHGYYYETFDFASNVGRQNLFDHPLGPGDAPNEFQHDGGEIIFSLPNGLQGYMLVDRDGKRIDKGPTNIVVDKNQGDAAVVNGISCMSCHVKGIIDKSDEIADHVRNNPGFFRDEAKTILALYVLKEQFALKLKEDAERFRAAVEKTGAHLSITEPIVALEKRYLAPLDLNQAAAEAGMRPKDYQRALERSKELSRILGPTVQRQVWEKEFGRLVRELELGKYHVPSQLTEFAERPPAVVNSIGMKLVLIPPGSFKMGSPEDEEDRCPDEKQHDVQITKPFYAGAFPVTQEQFKRVMGGRNPSYFSSTGAGKDKVQGIVTLNHPVEQVSREVAQEFCEMLSNLPEERKAGRTYRLPTEAQWEYFCRGGAKKSTPFYFGPTLTQKDANFASDKTTAVGLYKPNGFGLHDLHGNVRQWCQDVYDAGYYSNSPPNDPQGPSAAGAGATFGVLRGGSWMDINSKDCRSAARHRSFPDYQKGSGYGFRVVMEIVEKKP
jgi:serine/threonine protein kinase/formylglycine-generating enzyme required for sulfatase activity